MGIERYFNSIKTKYGSSIITDFTKQFNEKYFFIDFNCIVYGEAFNVENALKNLYRMYLTSLKIKNYYIENSDELNKHLNYLTTNLILKNKINFNKLSTEIIDKLFFKVVSENLDKLVLNKVGDYLKYLKSLFNNLELMYISVDGVPLYAKILQQKSRRFNKYFINTAQKKLIKNYKNELNKKISFKKEIFFNQYRYEKKILKFKFDTNKISPATQFMINLEEYLINLFKNEKFKFILDGFNNAGEAEMKIFVKIKSMNINEIIVFSPDADVILLMMLLFKNIIILRNNQQLNKLENISILNYKDILVKYLKIDNYSLNIINKIIEDVIMIFTVLGNDFIPRIVAINTYKHIDHILNSYLEINKNVTDENDYKLIFNGFVNYNLLLKFFENLFLKLEDDENNIVRKKYRYLEKKNFNAYYRNLYDLENLFNKYNINFNIPSEKYKYYKLYFLGFNWLYEYYIKNNFDYKLFGIKYNFLPNLKNIIKYLNIFIEKNNFNLKKYYIENNKYFIPVYHLAFISPTSILNIIDKNQKKEIILKIIEYDKKYNKDINLEINNGIINIRKYFNCYDKLFFNNCYLQLLSKLKIKKIINFFVNK